MQKKRRDETKNIITLRKGIKITKRMKLNKESK